MTSPFRSTLILALLALPMAAQPGPEGNRHADRISHALNLTEAQKTSIRDVREKYRRDMMLRLDAVKHAQIDLRTALRDMATPEPQLRALYDKASAARYDLIQTRRKLRREVQALLTPEQRAKAEDLRDRPQAGWHGRRDG